MEVYREYVTEGRFYIRVKPNDVIGDITYDFGRDRGGCFRVAFISINGSLKKMDDYVGNGTVMEAVKEIYRVCDRYKVMPKSPCTILLDYWFNTLGYDIQRLNRNFNISKSIDNLHDGFMDMVCFESHISNIRRVEEFRSYITSSVKNELYYILKSNYKIAIAHAHCVNKILGV